MEEYDSIEDLPPQAQKIVDVIIQSTFEVGIDRASIHVQIDDEKELGTAYVATGNHGITVNIVFTTDASKRVWIFPQKKI